MVAGSFRKHVQKYAEFVFVAAPHVIADDSDSSDADLASPSSSDDRSNSGDAKANGVQKDTDRSWWFNKEDNSFKGTNKNGPAYGFDVSLRLVEEVWQTQGPFQGILGFSQGACFVGLICNLSMRGSKCYATSAQHCICFHLIQILLFSEHSDRNQATICHTSVWFSFGQFGALKLL